MMETTRIINAKLTFIIKDQEPTEQGNLRSELMELTGADDVEIVKVQDFINDEDEPEDSPLGVNPYQE